MHLLHLHYIQSFASIYTEKSGYDYGKRLDTLCSESSTDRGDMTLSLNDGKLLVYCAPCQTSIVCDAKTRALGNVRDHMLRQCHQKAVLKSKAKLDREAADQKIVDQNYIIREVQQNHGQRYRHLTNTNKLQCIHCLKSFLMYPQRGSLTHNLKEHVKSGNCSTASTQSLGYFFTVKATKPKPATQA